MTHEQISQLSSIDAVVYGYCIACFNNSGRAKALVHLNIEVEKALPPNTDVEVVLDKLVNLGLLVQVITSNYDVLYELPEESQ